MNAKDFLEEIDYYNTNVDGEIFEDLGIETLADILEVYHQRKLKLLGIGVVSQQRELLLSELVEWLVINTDLGMEKVAEFEERFKQ
tara:strand:- start:274 stop:531 length:258 start_codon:yes stop_codon:yes gene_type:complete